MTELRLLPQIAEIAVLQDTTEKRRRMNLDALAQSLADLNQVIDEAERAKRRCFDLYMETLRAETE